MKKRQIFALILGLLLFAGLLRGPVFPAFAEETDPTDAVSVQEPDPVVTKGSHSPDAYRPIHESRSYMKSAASGILYEVTTDTMVYAWHPDTPLYPSSLTKIMTALLAIEKGDLNELVTVSWQALDSVPSGAMIAGFYPEELITLKELIYVMMVGSANDAAAVIAEHIGGSQEGFVDLMNQRAAELGCTGTRFVNAHGLHHPSQVTTARDMLKIIRQAMEYPFFMDVFGAPNYVLMATNKAEERTFRTTNYMGSQELTMDYYDERVTGGRTGNTDEGHRNLAITAEQDGAVYIAVVLQAESEYAENGVMLRQGAFEDAGLLLDLGFQESRTVQVLYAGQVVEQIPVRSGANDVVIGPMESVSCVLPRDLDTELITTSIELKDQNLTAPVAAGTHIGNCQVYYNGLCVANVPLYTKNDSALVRAEPQEPETPIEQGFDAGAISTAFIVLGVIFAVILVLGGGVILVRKLREVMGRSRNKKRRSERRRSR